MRIVVRHGLVCFMLALLVAFETKPARQPAIVPADAASARPVAPVVVKSAKDSIGSSIVSGTIEVRLDSAAEEYLGRLRSVLRPMRDTLKQEFDQIRRLPSVLQRDSAIQELNERWGVAQQEELGELLSDSAFTTRMWIDSIKGADTVFLRRVRRILASGGMFLGYSEGFYTESDLGARGDLIGATASMAFAEFLHLVHRGNSTLVHNDAGIVAPLDTLVGRIQGLEAFARAFPGTDYAERADTLQSFYLHSLICGEQNTRAFINDKPDRDFLAAWRHLAVGPDGPSRRLMRNWLAVLKSEKGRLTPRAKAWLEQRGYSPEIDENEEI